MIVFQSDGACSASAYSSLSSIFSDNGPYKSFFKVRMRDPASTTASGNEMPDYISGDATLATNQAKEVVDLLTASDQNSTLSGFSMYRKPTRIHCIAFGDIFDPASTNATGSRDAALALMQYFQYKGGVLPSAGTPLEDYKKIYGTDYNAHISKLKTAFSGIMQDGYSMTLIEAAR